MKLTTSRGLILLWLLVAVSVGQLLLPAWVLCLGADGHITDEQAYAGRCGLPSDGVASAFPTFESGEGHCGPCTDIPILTALFINASSARHAMTYSVPADSLASQPVATAIPSQWHHDASPPSGDPVHVSLRSTILLI